MNIEEEIKAIKERNSKVELDKAWETSKTRKVSIALLTYLVMVSIMYSLKMQQPFISSIIPTIGFLLSTLSANLLKQIWVKYMSK